MHRLLSLLLLSAILAPTHRAFAFDPDYILSEDDLTNEDAMSLPQIQALLESKGTLGDYETENWEGDEMSAAEIIWNASQDHGINPRFLLVLLQKEQSLVEDPDPTQKQFDWATGYAVCDDCSLSDASISRWKGFGKQVNSAALQFIEGYLADIASDGVTQGEYGPGVPVLIDGTTVVPENAATAAMYAYTPHLHGNELFVTIWERWFGFEYPTGTLLQAAGEDGVWRIEYGYRRAITSWSALTSRYNPDLIITVSTSVLEQYPIGRSIALPNYSLLENDGDIYLLVDDVLRPFENIETFHAIGFNDDELIEISDDELFDYDIGDEITLATKDPQGKVLRLANGATFSVENGVRHAILDATILTAHFPGVTPTVVDAVAIEQYREGNWLKLPDGYLVRSYEDPAVFVIAEGEKRPILSASVFEEYGYDWSDIVFVTQDVLDLHTTGDMLTVSTD